MNEPNREGFENAKAMLWAWKNDELRAYAVALVKAGIRALDDAQPSTLSILAGTFAPDDVPDELHPPGQGTSGAVTSKLLRAHVIEQFYGNAPHDGVMGGRRLSRSKPRNGAKVQLYRLCSRAIAAEFLRRHGASLVPKQTEFDMVTVCPKCSHEWPSNETGITVCPKCKHWLRAEEEEAPWN